MLQNYQENEIKKIINDSLDKAEEMWNNVTGVRKALSALMEETSTNIPGHPYLKDNEYKSDQFIAMMVDMRDSTKHLRQAISGRITHVNMMQRVFYEVSALLPAIAKVIEYENGAVTEYLGDGVLALFQLPKDEEEKRHVIYAASRASKNCIYVLSYIINPILDSRYKLPPIEIGVGIASSISL